MTEAVKDFRHMNRSDRILTFIGAQLLLCVFSIGIGALAFTLAPLIVSVVQLPLNLWIFIRHSEDVRFWRFVRIIQSLNVFICVVLITLIQIFGRRYFLIFLDLDAWSLSSFR